MWLTRDVVTFAATKIITPFSELNPVSGPIDLLGASKLIFTDGSQPLVCGDLIAACFGIYPLLPAVVPDLAWPLPFIYLPGHENVPRFTTLQYVHVAPFDIYL
jgi:hypothetical protein